MYVLVVDLINGVVPRFVIASILYIVIGIVACVLWMPFYAPAFVLYLTTLCYDIYHFLHIASSISCLEKTSTHGSNEIESLSFNIEDPQILLQVHTDLASLKKKKSI